MDEIVAGLIDRLRTVSLHQWLTKLVVALAGTALIVVCATATGAVLAGTTPVISGLLLACVLIWPEAMASIAFLAVCCLWWLFAWHGTLWATVPVAVLVGLVHLLAALAVGPGHAVVRLSALRFLSSRLAAYLLATAAAAGIVVALSSLPTSRYVAWLAVVAISAATLVATLVAGTVEEAGQVEEEPFEDEPFLPDDLR
ncbi:MAG: hypothetical protein HY829_08535 [Actinobacteria bacterium]|nr:hypothetical protein [Actinomycetota bacterium]